MLQEFAVYGFDDEDNMLRHIAEAVVAYVELTGNTPLYIYMNIQTLRRLTKALKIRLTDYENIREATGLLKKVQGLDIEISDVLYDNDFIVAADLIDFDRIDRYTHITEFKLLKQLNIPQPHLN